MNKFYLTTAIAYTSAVPHIGNVYEAVLADAICRYKRFKGYQVFFQTGTDEHGQKIQDKAENIKEKGESFIKGGLAKVYDIVKGTVVEKVAEKVLDEGVKVLKTGAKSIGTLGKKILKM